MKVEGANAPAIDMGAIVRLAEGDELGDKFVTEIIAVFLADLSERLRTIGLQMSQGDRVGVAATVHAIKGSCGHFGAARLMELSAEVEERARRAQIDNLAAAVDSVVAEAERVRVALEAYRAGPTES